nr:pleiotropic drug resistance protein 3 [Quercus suber]
MAEVSKREKEAEIVPDADIDTYMKIIGLDICADTLVRDATRRGISGGQKRRLTTDCSTAFQIVTCLQQLAHITDATVLVSLFQPAPETSDLFDDLILMSEGKIVYHGPRDHVLEFFEDCGSKCRERKALILSKKFGLLSLPLFIIACITMTVFLHTRMDIDLLHGSYYTGALFYALILLPVAGIPELSITVIQTKTILFLRSLGLCDSCKCFKAPGSSSAIISHEKHPKIKSCEDSCNGAHVDVEYINSPPQTSLELNKGNERMGMPLQKTPTSCSYYRFIGSGKTTLLDVLAGRMTSGYIEGQIKIGGYPKVQETFVRISGYCEQADIHSPQITVEESVIFSAWLRLSPEIDSKTKVEFVNEVLETIELGGIKNALVGIPGVTGLSTEQRKWLTNAGELVANPSIMFMDERTTGLDARAAATVIQAVKNVADTGRTTFCTIHQPSIDIFEAFDEGILGVPKIRNNYNPATWMFKVTSTSVEAALGVDFAQKYGESALYM